MSVRKKPLITSRPAFIVGFSLKIDVETLERGIREQLCEAFPTSRAMRSRGRCVG